GDWIAQKLGYQEFNEDSLFTAEVNIRFGAWYLNYLDEKFNQNHYLIISGYNAGPGVTERWMQSMDMSDIDYFIENIPYPETSEHIKRVNRTWNLYRLIYGK
ncbi:MAG: lytic transglycosylase domain-containing protein, partial [Candidatus Atribacteria bacterium]|nr:lytic transglycosylase domain-containing protein [Candidatus Atribacteria bacterium]